MSDEPAQFEPEDRILTRIGIVVACGADDLGKALFARIVRMELQRRLPGAVIRCFGLEPYAQPQGLDGGEALEPIGAWTGERCAELAEGFDCLIVGGGDLDSGPVTGGLGGELEERCPVTWLGVGLTGRHSPDEFALVRSALDRSPYVSVKDEASKRLVQAAGLDREVEVVPQPALVATRHFDREGLDKRLAYLRLMGWYPAKARALVVQGDGPVARFGAALAGPIGRILKEEDVSVVVAEIASPAGGGEFARMLSESLSVDVHRIPSEVAVEDWVAAFSFAHGFIGTAPAGAALAAAFGVPAVLLNLDGRFDTGGLQVPGVASVGEGKEVADAFEQAALWPAEGAPDRTVLAPLRDRLDRHLDRVAEIAREAGVRRGRREPRDRPDLEAEAALLRTVHDVLSRRLAAERSLFADRAASWPEVARLEAKVSWLATELRSLKARRLYRYSAPLLSMYGTVRRWLGLKR